MILQTALLVDPSWEPAISTGNFQGEPTNPKMIVLASCWCERGDSNPHGFPRQILSLVRLPIPPLSHISQATPVIEPPGGDPTPASQV